MICEQKINEGYVPPKFDWMDNNLFATTGSDNKKNAQFLTLWDIRKQKDSSLNEGEITSIEISKSKYNILTPFINKELKLIYLIEKDKSNINLFNYNENKFTKIKDYNISEASICSVLFNRKLLEENKKEIDRFAICSNSIDNKNIQNISFSSFYLPKDCKISDSILYPFKNNDIILTYEEWIKEKKSDILEYNNKETVNENNNNNDKNKFKNKQTEKIINEKDKKIENEDKKLINEENANAKLYNDLINRNEKLEKKNIKMKEKNEKLKEENNENKSQLKLKLKENEEKQNKINELETKFQEEEKKNKELNNKYEEEKKQKEKLDKDLKDEKKKNENLINKNTYDDLNKKYEELSNKHNNMEKLYNKLKEKYEEEKKKKNEDEKKKSEAQNKELKEKYEKEKKKSEEQYNELKGKYEKDNLYKLSENSLFNEKKKNEELIISFLIKLNH